MRPTFAATLGVAALLSLYTPAGAAAGYPRTLVASAKVKDGTTTLTTTVTIKIDRLVEPARRDRLIKGLRQNGYQDWTQKVILQPAQTQIIHVAMNKAATGPMPPDDELVTIKVIVNPSRAAVFLDGRFVGHVGEFEGVGRALQVTPGAHRIRIALPGYATFQADINPLPKQKVEVKTDLVKTANPLAEPLLGGETNATPAASDSKDAARPQY